MVRRLHRAQIEALNRLPAYNLRYYTEVRVERRILPLVRILNNRWTFTVHSCEGHWGSGTSRNEPYVSFFVLPGRYPQWGIIQRCFLAEMADRVSLAVTIDVMESYDLPYLHPQWIRWGFEPAYQRTAEGTFTDRTQYRQAMDRIIGVACKILRKYIAEAEEFWQAGC
jgi:hypothetical protein